MLVFVFSVFIASCSQLLLKRSAGRNHGRIIKEYLNPEVVGAYIVLLVSTLLTIYAYRGVALKWGPVLESAGFVFVLLLSALFFRERISRNKVWGMILILGGIALFNL